MKTANKIYMAAVLFVAVAATGCNNFLDRLPLDSITPEEFFNSESDLSSYVMSRYNFGSYSGYGLSILRNDNNTDNQAAVAGNTGLWVPGEKKVAETDDSNWNFNHIRQVNYFFDRVLPKYEAGLIKGSATNIRHYIGEAYFLRANTYFSKLVTFGDFPIITELLPDDRETLIESSKRAPRNEVARFIISDLDKAIEMMVNNPPGGKNRLTRNAALLLKSRVALYEGTWLKYHAGTSRVPGGPGWPGAGTDYNAGFTLDIPTEAEWFLAQSMDAAAKLADAITLTENTGVFNPPYDAAKTGSGTDWNPYFEMFSAVDMNSCDEVVFWRAYSTLLAATSLHCISTYLVSGGDTGYTRSMVDAFTMENGLPIYAAGSGYWGDKRIEDLKKNRDHRLQLFVAAPSDVARLENAGVAAAAGTTFKLFDAPTILQPTATKMVTGYASRKCLTYELSQASTGPGLVQTYGCMLFRGVEAHLNYMEACYELNGTLDAKAEGYWKQIRKRAGVEQDFMKTVNATDLTQENDWAVYSAGEAVDPLLYNIRRERRIELMQENTRMRDLKRWRSLDQVEGYQIEGFNLWDTGANQDLYVDDKGKSLLVPQGATGNPNVSNSTESGKYLRPYQIVKSNNNLFDGYTWTMANYLEPVAVKHIRLASRDFNDLSQSTIYQNPGWGTVAGEPAEE